MLNKTLRAALAGLLVVSLGGLAAPALAFDHQQWDRLLDKHVSWRRDGVASAVDYDGMADDAAGLNQYLQRLSDVDMETFDDFSDDQKLAFLINAYNAFTVKLILKQESRPDSIRDIGSIFSGPWSQRFFTLLGKERTLDELEHQMIRGNPALMDPRIHFAVNCASVGCPALRPEAYTGEKLDAQLADSTRRFLSDRRRNRYDADSEVLRVSSIFDWYEEDFEDSAGSLGDYLLQYADILALPPRTRRGLEAGDLPIRFLDYDWSL
ncbi:MAG TPA: DUF547 domain-containing protein, partial [Alcanivorax sp.]|nr:DUF547 domain-containing protein [Alcanivorax sp.]